MKFDIREHGDGILLGPSRPHRRKGLAAGLLIDAITRALRADIAAFAIVVDAKDDAAVAVYNHHDFIAFASATMSLYLPLAKAAHAMGLDPKIGRA